MVNISLLEKSIPVAPIKIAALKSCSELASQVDAHPDNGIAFCIRGS